MEFVHEVTAHLENKPGRLAKICSALAHEKVHIQALCVMDSHDRSVLRLVTDDVALTKKVLTSLGTESQSCEVLGAQVENSPGGLAKILERLAAEHINIEYAYVAGGVSPGKSMAIFHTSNPRKALQVLTDHNAKGVDHSNGRRPLHVR